MVQTQTPTCSTVPWTVPHTWGPTPTAYHRENGNQSVTAVADTHKRGLSSATQGLCSPSGGPRTGLPPWDKPTHRTQGPLRQQHPRQHHRTHSQDHRLWGCQIDGSCWNTLTHNDARDSGIHGPRDRAWTIL